MESPTAHIVELLGDDANLEPLQGRGARWLVSRGELRAVLRRSRQGPEANLESLAWVHRFLADLPERSDIAIPKPLPLLQNTSWLATEDGFLWETLSFIPGIPAGFGHPVAAAAAGDLLARFHLASSTVPRSEQRPSALPMEACRPLTEPAIVAAFVAGLEDIGHAGAAMCGLHGDATLGNMLLRPGSDPPELGGLIDFELAHVGPPESDVSFALWVTGRTAQSAHVLDLDRVRTFVAAYHRVRPLSTWSIRAVPLYLIGRGLQMRVRLERHGVDDQVQLSRLRWVYEHRHQLERAVASALGDDS